MNGRHAKPLSAFRIVVVEIVQYEIDGLEKNGFRRSYRARTHPYEEVGHWNPEVSRERALAAPQFGRLL
jgi:hypothetical protein